MKYSPEQRRAFRLGLKSAPLIITLFSGLVTLFALAWILLSLGLCGFLVYGYLHAEKPVVVSGLTVSGLELGLFLLMPLTMAAFGVALLVFVIQKARRARAGMAEIASYTAENIPEEVQSP